MQATSKHHCRTHRRSRARFGRTRHRREDRQWRIRRTRGHGAPADVPERGARTAPRKAARPVRLAHAAGCRDPGSQGRRMRTCGSAVPHAPGAAAGQRQWRAPRPAPPTAHGVEPAHDAARGTHSLRTRTRPATAGPRGGGLGQSLLHEEQGRLQLPGARASADAGGLALRCSSPDA